MRIESAASAKEPFRGPYRLEMACDVTFDGPVHVGTGERLALTTDSPILRDAKGEPYLPGSSLRGPLRDFCEREAIVLGISREAVIRLFGPDKGEAETNDRRGRLTVTDAVLTDSGSEIRDHVRLDPKTGAAATAGKFDGEVLLGAKAKFSLIYEGRSENEEEVLLLSATHGAMVEDRILTFGAKGGWGFGSIRDAKVDVGAVDRTSPALLAGYLKARLSGQTSSFGGAKPLDLSAMLAAHKKNRMHGRGMSPIEKDLGLHPWSWLSFDLVLQFQGPFLVGGPHREESGNPCPHAGGLDSSCNCPWCQRAKAEAVFVALPDGTPYLPGSSLRGALQAHARRIAVTEQKAWVANALFGSARNEGGQRGLLRIGDGTIERERLNWVFLNHVAIDRLTGFAAHGKLFDALALDSPRIRHRVVVRWKPGEDANLAGVGLLLFALRDMGEALLWAGSRTTRGYGHITSIAIENGKISKVADTGGVFSREAPVTLDGDVKSWRQHKVIEDFVRAWVDAKPAAKDVADV